MEHILTVEQRSAGKKGAAKKLRKNGKIPAIVYGNNSSPLPIKVDALEFHKEFSKISESTIITLKIPEVPDKHVLIKDYQHNIIRDEIAHLDFYEIQKGKLLRTLVSIELSGSAEGLKYGGVVESFTHEVEVESLPRNLPEFIKLDTSHLALGDSLHISDLPAIEGVKYLNPPDQVIVHIAAPRKTTAAESEEAEEAAEDESESSE